MDVRCERCKTEYEFEEARITEAGVTVKCTTCSHVFRVKKKTLAVTLPVPSAEPSPTAGGSKPKEWKLRQANGNILQFKELTTLQKWIVERKVTRDDEISVTGESWKALGTIVELSSFFQIVEEANSLRGPVASLSPSKSPSKSPAQDVGAMPVMDSVPGVHRGGTEPEFPMARSPLHRKSGLWTTVWLLVLLAGVAYFGYAYYWEPRQREARLNAAAEKAARTAREDAAKKAAAEQMDAGTGTGTEVTPAPTTAASPEDAGTVAAAEVDAGPAPEPPAQHAKKPPGPVVHDYDYYLVRAELLRERGRTQQALDAYGQAADLEPRRAEPVAGRGLVFLDQSQHLQAQAAFEQALKLNPRYGVAIIGLAETYRALGRDDEAADQYERYLEVLPDGPESNVARNALRKLKP